MGATVIGLLYHAGPMLNCLAKKALDRMKKKGLDKDNCLAFLFFCVSGPLSLCLNNHQSALGRYYSYSEWGWATEEHLLGAGGLHSLRVLDP